MGPYEIRCRVDVDDIVDMFSKKVEKCIDEEAKQEQKSFLSYHNAAYQRSLSSKKNPTRKIVNLSRQNTRNNIKGFNRINQNQISCKNFIK
jgi:hypothetical protein